MPPKLHFVCATCRLRFGVARTCPECGGTAFDLDNRRQARQLGRALRRAQPRGRAASLVGLATVLVLLALAPVLLLVPPIRRSLLTRAGRLRRAFLRPPPVRAWLPAVPDDLPRLRGRARPLALLEAPLGQDACIGFRLVGRTRKWQIDLSRCAPFDLVCESGETVRVEPCMPVCVDLPTKPSPGRVWPQVLREVGYGHPMAPFTLGEALLHAGEYVEVAGEPDARVAAESYREVQVSRVIAARSIVTVPRSPAAIDPTTRSATTTSLPSPPSVR
jgi:hypothetical protein